ncbi:MAG: hypothetical protein ABH826_01925 [Patescibacteria group bacterium]
MPKAILSLERLERLKKLRKKLEQKKRELQKEEVSTDLANSNPHKNL